MPNLYAITTSGSAAHQIREFDPPEIIGPAFIGEHETGTPYVRIILGPQNLTPSEREFEEQKTLFQQILPLFLEQYRNQFVASMNGQIVDSDEDFITLAHRFFAANGDVPVYITKIGDDPGIVIDTPFFD